MDPRQTILSGLIQRGVPAHIAQGMVTGMTAESGLNPGINEIKPLVPGSRGGYGLNQWTGPRRVAYETFAAERGKPLDDLDTQLDFTMHEMQGPERRAWGLLQGAQTPEDAASIYETAFLRPGIPHGGRGRETISTMNAPQQPQTQAEAPNNGPLGGLLGIKRDTSKLNDLGLMLMALSNPRAAPMMAGMLQDRRKTRSDQIAKTEAQQQQQQQVNRTIEWLRSQPGGEQFAGLAGVLGPAEALNAYMGAQKGNEPTALIQNYEYFLKQGMAPEAAMAAAKGGTTVNVNAGPNSSKFVDKSDEAAAARFDTYVSEGAKAGQFMGDLQALALLGTQIETGAGTQALAALGPFADAVGIEIEGLGPAQAYKAITDRLAPMMRAPGSGATSDFEGRQFLNALPNLGRTSEGNQIVMETLQALQQHKMAAAEIASRAQTGEMSWQEAEKQIRDLGNPYERFSEFKKRSEGAPKPESPPPGAATHRFNPETGQIEAVR